MKVLYIKDCKSCIFFKKDTIVTYCTEQFSKQTEAMKLNRYIKNENDSTVLIYRDCPLPNMSDTKIIRKSEIRRVMKPLQMAFELGCMDIINSIWHYVEKENFVGIKNVFNKYIDQSKSDATGKVSKENMIKLRELL